MDHGYDGGDCVPEDTDCCVDNGTPGCDFAPVEACVCEVDPFCCDTAWDDICADEAVTDCALVCP